MKKTIKLAVVAALALGTTSVFATNGINQIATGAKARGMGGVGIATNLNGENVYSNPSMITRTKKAYINAGVNLFNADVSMKGSGDTAKSKYPMSVIPSVSGVYAINESFFIGGAFYGSGGMGVDYTDDKDLKSLKIKTELAVAVIAVPMAYTVSGFSVGFTPLIKTASLSLPGYFGTHGTKPDAFDQQSSRATNFGFELGADYELKLDDSMALTFAGVYKSAVELDFGKDVLITNDPGKGDDKNSLATPSVIGLGINFDFGASTVAFDYKNIGYGSAKGFEDFDWKDQNVYAIGYQYAADVWAVRAGYNYGESPIDDGKKTTTSLMYFPAVTTSHYTLGGTWNVNKNNELDLGLVIADGEQTKSDAFGPGSGDLKAINKQTSVALGYTYNF